MIEDELTNFLISVVLLVTGLLTLGPDSLFYLFIFYGSQIMIWQEGMEKVAFDQGTESQIHEYCPPTNSLFNNPKIYAEKKP